MKPVFHFIFPFIFAFHFFFLSFFTPVLSLAESQRPVSAAPSALPRLVFAHYMGCFPAGYGAIDFHRREMGEKLRHDSKDFLSSIGGRFVNFPLTPQDAVLTPEASAELEIRRAMRAGIDGFAVDAWAGGDSARNTFCMLIEAAQRLNVPFYVTLCMDSSCHQPPDAASGRNPKDYSARYTESLLWVLTRYGKSPNLARRDGKILIFGYHSRDIFRDTVNADGSPSQALEGPEAWDASFGAAFRELAENVKLKTGEQIYVHFCFDAFFHAIPPQRLGEKTREEAELEAARYLGTHFGAVGGFLGDSWSERPEVIHAIREGGAEWSQPLIFQYNNKSYMYISQPGLNLLCDRWERAIKTDAELLQFVTWNDYGEDTILAPGYSTGYTISCVNRYFSDLWKSGNEKTLPDDEQIHVIFRRLTRDADIPYPFSARTMNPNGVLEVLTLLREPAHITVPDYGEYDAPAGLFRHQFSEENDSPLHPGSVSAQVQRHGKTVLSVRAPEEVTDRPFREDNSMVCFSSNFDALWAEDFGTSELPLHYSEYGDADADGLPNWFEMYWFGTFPDMKTAADAQPDADPDGDGISNLQEFQNRTNPLEADTPVTVGEKWNFDAIHARGVSFNPDRDRHGNPVWYYLYKHGPRLATPHDGHYIPCPFVSPDCSYAGKMAHLSPSQDPEYKYIHGWIARAFSPETETWSVLFRPRVQALAVLGWKSPVSGKVTVQAVIEPLSASDPITLNVARNADSLWTRTFQKEEGETLLLRDISVEPGDFIYFIADEAPQYDASELRLHGIEIEFTGEKTE